MYARWEIARFLQSTYDWGRPGSRRRDLYPVHGMAAQRPAVWAGLIAGPSRQVRQTAFVLVRREILRRPADEPPLTAVHNSLLVAAGELDGGLAILFVGAPPRALTGQTRRTHVLTEFEDGIMSALAERFAEHDPEERAQRRALRASVLARASLAAVRSALIMYTQGDEEAGSRRIEDFPALLDEAFAVLRTPGGV
ncbi:hypothetical protein AB0L59_22865 [Streptomyces sp. NPDC052109]|uniref:hypothetical protein n=1 Tax=Streptomyces sp. NPDC052109 TaxID=3155527 RepID=UPI0034397465